MIENSYNNYSKKIVPYLDGSMSQEEISEFEAFVMTHPELEAQVTTKAEEMSLLKSMIPVQTPSYETHESIENELKQSVFNLLKEDHRTLLNRIQDKWEEFVNR